MGAILDNKTKRQREKRKVENVDYDSMSSFKTNFSQ